MHGRTLLRPLALACSMALAACSSATYVTVPPRVDLQRFDRVALVALAHDEAAGPLRGPVASHFVEEVLAAQWGVEIVEVRHLPDGYGPGSEPAELAQAVGSAHEAAAVFLLGLGSSGLAPSGGLGGPAGFGVRADVAAELTAQLVSTESGGTLWRGSGSATRTVGAASMGSGVPSVAFRNPDAAWDEVAAELAREATRDFRPTRVRQ